MQRCAIWMVVVLALVLGYLWSHTLAEPEPQGLPGARSAIDAGQYPTLQAAFDALPESGGVVRIPPGEFEITKPLVIRVDDVCIEGAGTATHIKNLNEEGGSALLIAHPDAEPGRSSQHRLWRVRIANLQITGNEKSGVGIEARLINEVFIQGVTVSRHGSDGILLDYCYEDPRVCDSLITYNRGVGLNLVGCHDIVVASNQFEENQDALHCIDGFNLCMTGNCLDDHLGHGVVIENTYGSVVAGNMIEECKGTAIILDRDCYGITLSANVIAHNGGGIDLRDAHGCAVSANTMTIMATDALRIGPASGRISVGGNSICNSYIGDGQVRRGSNDLLAAGVVLEGARDIGMTGNVFSGVRPKALQLQGEPSRGVTFVGNVVRDAESDHGQLQDAEVGLNRVEPPES
jgi:parallel beta-helix repeat protein